MQTWLLTNQASTITVVHRDNLVQTTYTLTKTFMVLDFPFLITATHSPAMLYLSYNDGSVSYKFDIAILDLIAPSVDDGKELWDTLVDWIYGNVPSGSVGSVNKVFVTAADFTGGVLTNPAITALLVGKALTSFEVRTDNGSGTFPDLTDGINSFNSVTGELTLPADKYVILIF